MAAPKFGLRTYWVGLFALMRKLCRYYRRWKDLLPKDLPSSVLTALNAVETACDALDQYDIEHAGGGE